MYGILTSAEARVADVPSGTREISAWLLPAAISPQSAIEAAVAACSVARYENDMGEAVDWSLSHVSEPYEVLQETDIGFGKPIEVYSKLVDANQWELLLTMFDWHLVKHLAP